ncbi:YadA-like family protein [Avibacterium avium]|uniref:YadA-like family protein n=1 Tax=Avibacterium avium TaxID=751 RepID=UPI003BF7A266
MGQLFAMLKIALLFRGGGAFAVGNANGTISVSNSGVFGNGNTLTDQATSSRVVGNNNYVNGQESFVLGNDVKVQKDKAGTSARVIGIGSNVTVNDNDSIAIGTGTYAEGNFVTAIGNKANASGDQAVAIGSNTVARESSTALGQQAQATGNTALAVGAVAKAEGNNSMAVGQYSQAVGVSSTAVGPGALAGKNNAVALGYLAKATEGGALALGYGAQATVAGAVALGENSVTGRADKTASATVNGITYSDFAGADIGSSRVVSVGSTEDGKQRQIQNVAAGRITNTSTDAINGSQLYAVANELSGRLIHYYSVNDNSKQGGNYNNDGATGINALAAGVGAQAQGQDSLAQGTEAKSYGESTIAIGKNARSGRGKKGFATSLADEPEANSIAIGNNAQAPNKSSIALGDNATVQYFAPDAIAIGTNARIGTYATTSIAIGKEATAKHYYNTAIGPKTVTDGVGATAVGFSAQALGRASFAAGQGAKTENQATVAIGENAKATLANNVSLGSGARDRQAAPINDATVQGITYSGFAGKAKAVVSVGTKAGERQIINVAPGEISENSTDAINGSQLYMVANTLGNVANTTTNILGGNATLDPNTGNITMTDIGGTGQNTINDAIKVAKTRYYSVNDGGKQSANYNNDGAKSEGALAAGVRANAIGADDVAIGSNALADSSNNVNEPAAVAVGHNAKATAAGAVAVGDSAEALSTNVVSMGYSAGSGSNAENSIWIGANSGNSATGSSNIGIGDGAGNGIGETNPYSNYNVAMGVYAGGGLNGSNNLSLGISAGNTLNGNDNVTLGNAAGANLNGNNNIAIGRQAGTAVVVNSDPNNPIFESGDSDTREVNDSISLGNNAQALKDNAIAIGLNAQAKNENDVALGAGAITEAAVPTTEATVNQITYTGFAGTSPIATLSVGSADKERTITNVAAGRINKDSTDAINGSQLYVVADKLSNAVNNITNATNGGFILTDDSKTEVKQGLGKSIQLKGEKGITVTANAADKQLKIALGNEITVGNPEDPSNPNAPKEAGTINVVGKDGKNGVSIKGDTGNDGKPGISIAGKDGADGVTLTTKTDGKPGVDGKDGPTKPRLEVNNEQVATLNDGVKYAGDIGNAAIKLNQTATIVGGVKDKSNLTDNNIGVVASQDGDDAKLTVKLAKNLNLGPDGSITISNSSNDSSSVRLNKGGLDNGGNKIINVADGDISQNSKDAVNGGQLYNTIQQTVKAVKIEVKEGDNIVITSDVGSDGQTIYTVSTVKDVKFDSAKIGNKVTINNNGIDAGDTKVTGVKAGDVSKDSTDAVNGSQLHETNQKVAKNATNIANNTAAIKKGLNFTADDGKTLNRQLGDTVAVNGDENVIASVTSSGVKVALNKKLKVDSVTAGNTVVNNDGVIIGTGDKAVSLTQNGLNNGGNRITNVAPGKDPTDAVNVAQLSNVTNHLDNKVNKVASDMKHMDKKLRAGIAGAAALGVLAQPTRPGKSMVSVGGTTYRDESAVALGVSRVSDNEKWVIKIGASANTRNNYIAGGSVGYQW